jgi:hypothetical protein
MAAREHRSEPAREDRTADATSGELASRNKQATSGRPAAAPAGIEQSIRAIERAASAISTMSVARMDEVLPWFRGLPADQRSWVTLVAQAGVRSLVTWLRDPDQRRSQEIADEIFDAAPRMLARAINLQHTVELIEVTISVVEERVSALAVPEERPAVVDAILRFSREVAFSAARVYARAAESRSTWDARLQAQLVDAVLHGEAPEVVASRAAVLGWDDRTPVAVTVGPSPGGDAPAILFTVYRLARRMGLDVIGGVQGNHLVLILGGAPDPLAATEKLIAAFGRVGPVAVGPAMPSLAEASESAHAALAAFRAAPAWPAAPRPVAAGDLLPERVLAGDTAARRELRLGVYGALVRAGGELLETLDAFFATGGVLESTARTLFVHPNTVRYRLRRVGEVTGLSPVDGRAAFTLRLALTIGRLDPSTGPKDSP